MAPKREKDRQYAQPAVVRSSARLAAAGVKTPQHPAVEAGTPKTSGTGRKHGSQRPNLKQGSLGGRFGGIDADKSQAVLEPGNMGPKHTHENLELGPKHTHENLDLGPKQTHEPQELGPKHTHEGALDPYDSPDQSSAALASPAPPSTSTDIFKQSHLHFEEPSEIHSSSFHPTPVPSSSAAPGSSTAASTGGQEAPPLSNVYQNPSGAGQSAPAGLREAVTSAEAVPASQAKFTPGASGFGSLLSGSAASKQHSSPDGARDIGETAPLAAALEPNAAESAPAVFSNKASGTSASVSQAAADLQSKYAPVALGGTPATDSSAAVPKGAQQPSEFAPALDPLVNQSGQGSTAAASKPNGVSDSSQASPLAAALAPIADDSAPVVFSNKASSASASLSQTAADLQSKYAAVALGGTPTAAQSGATGTPQDAPPSEAATGGAAGTVAPLMASAAADKVDSSAVAPIADDSAPAVFSNKASGASASLSQAAADLQSKYAAVALGGTPTAAHSGATGTPQDAPPSEAATGGAAGTIAPLVTSAAAAKAGKSALADTPPASAIAADPTADAQGMGPSSRRPRSGFNNDNAQPPKPAYHVDESAELLGRLQSQVQALTLEIRAQGAAAATQNAMQQSTLQLCMQQLDTLGRAYAALEVSTSGQLAAADASQRAAEARSQELAAQLAAANQRAEAASAECQRLRQEQAVWQNQKCLAEAAWARQAASLQFQSQQSAELAAAATTAYSTMQSAIRLLEDAKTRADALDSQVSRLTAELDERQGEVADLSARIAEMEEYDGADDYGAHGDEYAAEGAEPEGGQEDGDDQAQVPGEEQGPSRGLPTSSALPVPPEAGVGHSSEAIERAAQAPAASSSEVARPGMGSAVRNLSAVLESFAGLGMSQGSQ